MDRIRVDSHQNRRHEAELAEGALVVVELRVAGAVLAHHGDLRAEPPDGEAAVEGVHPQ